MDIYLVGGAVRDKLLGMPVSERDWVVVGAEHPEPALLQWSSYGADWNRQEATTSWVENPDPDAFGRAIEIAKELGNVKAANIVALAAFVTRSNVLDFALLQKAVKEKFAQKEKLIPLNMKALEAGRKAALAK